MDYEYYIIIEELFPSIFARKSVKDKIKYAPQILQLILVTLRSFKIRQCDEVLKITLLYR